MYQVSKRALIKDTIDHIGREVLLKGWVQTVRSHGKIAFFDLRDRSGTMQVVGLSNDQAMFISSLSSQDAVEVTGVVKKRDERYINKNVPTGTIELESGKIDVISKSSEMPFDMGGKELKLELPTLLDYRSLTLNHPTVSAIFKVQAKILEGFRKAAENIGCIEIVVPTIVASSTEGGANLFSIDYYEHKAFLSQSPQLYKQMMVSVFERVWTIAHAYRAEPSVTTRHLTETTQMDCEIGFTAFEELLDLLEKVATDMVKYAESQCQSIFSQQGFQKIAFGSPRSAGGAGKIPRLTLREAQEVIFKEFGRDNRKEKDLNPQDEIDICKWAKDKHKSDFVTITHFPTTAKPFYTMPDPKDPTYSLSYDLLFKGIEILSGSQRISDYNKLTKSIKDRGMDPKNFGMYLMSFKYGMPEEGGFSFGLERITMKMLNLANVREASLFPRDMERVDERFSISDKKDTKAG
ncbi:MAG: aspartate--tRNA(Asn) ligase [bacterium]|nr:aspartate--tRNA(Asn) ligase [bacterium]